MAADIFLKLGDIKGESQDARHKDEIEIHSFSWGITNPATMHGGGAGAGKANFHDLSVAHNIDKASPMLLQACATGRHLPEAIISHRKAGQSQQDYLVVKLNDVIVTGVTQSGMGGQPGLETVTLSFGKVDFEYRTQKPDGSLEDPINFRFDLRANRVG
jgi:type VI secretion system secreted protein Hcp